MSFLRFSEGAAVVGRGWVVRLGRMRLMWAPAPDPHVTKVVCDEENVIRLTITWQPEDEPR